jgi:hypothetical protein
VHGFGWPKSGITLDAENVFFPSLEEKMREVRKHWSTSGEKPLAAGTVSA